MSATLITDLFRAVDAKKWEALADFYDPDVIYERPGYEPLQGFEALLEFYREVRVINTGVHHIEHILADETHAACWGRFLGASKTGASIDERFADIYALKDGRIRQRRSHFFRPAI